MLRQKFADTLNLPTFEKNVTMNKKLTIKRINRMSICRFAWFALMCFVSVDIGALDYKGSFKIGDLYFSLYDDMTAKVRDNQYGGGQAEYVSGKVIIPPTVEHDGVTYTVTGINSDAFANCTELEAIDIPRTVKIINERAFQNCVGLSELFIPNTLEEIRNQAFVGCTGLKKLFFEDGEQRCRLESASPFKGCALDEMYIGRSLDFSFGGGAHSVTIGKYVTYLNISFDPHVKMSRVNIEDLESWCKIEFRNQNSNPCYYGAELYFNGEKMTHFAIPNTITEIKDYAFYGSCITSVEIPSSVCSIGFQAFAFSDLTSVEMPNSVTDISWLSFAYCDKMKSLKLSNSLTTINNQSFLGCTSLMSAAIPSSVKEIGEEAFYRCNALTSVTIGANVEYIGNLAFGGNKKIEEVYCEAPVPPYCYGKDDIHNRPIDDIHNQPFDDIIYASATLYVPETKLELYESADPWMNFWNIEGRMFDSVTNVDSDRVKVSVSDGALHVLGTSEGARIEVFSMTGALLYSGGDTVISIDGHGIFIVRVDGSVYKVMN